VNRSSRTALALFLATLFVGACDDSTEGPPIQAPAEDVITEVIELPDQPVNLSFEGVLANGPTTSYTTNGTQFDVTLLGVYLVIGNVTVLSAGDPVPSFEPNSGERDPLGVGIRSLLGYQIVNLLTGTTLDTLEVAAGRAGPIYFGNVEADGSTAPLAGEEWVPEIGHARYLLKARIVVGELLDKTVEVSIPGDELMVLGAPAFDSTKSNTIRLQYDLDGWFQDVDIATLSHTSNTIYINANENAAAYAIIAGRMLESLATPTIVWE